LLASYRTAHPELAAEFEQWLAGRLPEGWETKLPTFTPADGQLATRQASSKSLNTLATLAPNLVGGSADLAESTGAEIKGGGSFTAAGTGRNIHWGVREHAMGACLNGMAAHGGVRPFGSTFLIFTDYCKPAIRLSALMALPVIYVGTHDSIGLGEDGPTHQPIEHLASLRAMPNLRVVRPADANEVAHAWRLHIDGDGPLAIVLARQSSPVLAGTLERGADGLARGAYVLVDESGASPDVVLIGTGSEVSLCVDAAATLSAEGRSVRVVSFPCWELFEAQPSEYRDSVLPAGTPTLAVEAGATLGWERYADDVVGLDHFGASAPGGTVLAEFGFTADNVAARARALLERGPGRR
jgi:transketolase